MEKQALTLLMLTTLLFACCLQNPPAATTTTTTQESLPAPEYKGFMELSAGQWVEYALPKGLEEKMYYLGEDELDGKKLAGLEVQLRNSSDYLGTFQLWLDPTNDRVVKFIGRIKGKVLCANSSNVSKQFSGLPQLGGTPDRYLPGKEGNKKYVTLISGKTVYCAEFASNGTKVLASSSVPFGIVRAVGFKETNLIELVDYGAGMQRTITKKEVDECRPVGFS